MKQTLSSRQKNFIESAVMAGALRFGEFRLKNGRISPYFFNTGFFNRGDLIFVIGKAFAQHIIDNYNDKFDLFFGPAYKGIPLVVSTSIAYSIDYGINKGWIFNRKETKEHGDKGLLVGAEVYSGDRILMLDDVFTTGDTKIESIRLIQSVAEVNFTGVVIAMDRQEVNDEGENAIKSFEDKTGIRVSSIITASETFDWLRNRKINGKVYVTDETYNEFQKYKELYGIK
ncbi:orotate phosphoribosyltransferase [Candidatus Micrarchaeota archaeon]|nr:orotate phosphoribosyltransferase [Candidatus Micrarchaeota archaeon]